MHESYFEHVHEPRNNPASEPEPNLIVTSRDLSSFQTANPGPADLRLVVEIADTTLGFDLRRTVGVNFPSEHDNYPGSQEFSAAYPALVTLLIGSGSIYAGILRCRLFSSHQRRRCEV